VSPGFGWVGKWGSVDWEGGGGVVYGFEVSLFVLLSYYNIIITIISGRGGGGGGGGPMFGMGGVVVFEQVGHVG